MIVRFFIIFCDDDDKLNLYADERRCLIRRTSQSSERINFDDVGRFCGV